VLQQARADGAAEPERISELCFPGDAPAQRLGAHYLRENIQFRMGEREIAGVERFFELAEEVGAVGAARKVQLY
jgi:hypothetical protein